MKFIRSVHVSKRDNGDFWLHWTPEFSSMPVSVFLSDNLGNLTSGVPVVSDAVNSVELPDCLNGKRQYFYLRSQDGAEAIVAERLLPLEGGTNFRDCGGYPAANGRRVKWNHLYRSGYMSNLSPADVGYLSNLGIKICCDFRGDKEQKNEPSVLPESTKIIPLTIDTGDITSYFKLASSGTDNLPDMSNMMADFNIKLVENYTEQYGAMLSQLLALKDGAFMVNCSAGKDRTGFGVALILMALGVPREAIMHDYLLSQKYFLVNKEIKRIVKKYQKISNSHVDENLLRPLLETKESYLGAALDYIEKQYGTPEQYLLKKFSIDQYALDTLRNEFTE